MDGRGMLTLVLLLGFAAGNAGTWMHSHWPAYKLLAWWQRAAIRLALIGVSAGILALCISFAAGAAPAKTEPEPHWMLWSIGVLGGYILEEITAFIDHTFP